MVMKRRKVVFSLKFKDSFQQYILYVKSNSSPEMAKHVKNGILETCRGLADFSGYSKELFIIDKSTEYRSVTKWNYLIIYKIKDDEIWILNIIHTSRNPAQRNDI